MLTYSTIFNAIPLTVEYTDEDEVIVERILAGGVDITDIVRSEVFASLEAEIEAALVRESAEQQGEEWLDNYVEQLR